jgi:hypothetical protein
MELYVLSRVIGDGHTQSGDIFLVVYLQNQSYDSNKLVVRVYSKGWENLFFTCNLFFQHNLNLVLYGAQMELRPFYHTLKLMYNTIDKSLLKSKSRISIETRLLAR